MHMWFVSLTTLSLSWLVAFLTQLNPLIGPNVHTGVAAHIRREWNGFGDQENIDYKCKLISVVLSLMLFSPRCSGFPNW